MLFRSEGGILELMHAFNLIAFLAGITFQSWCKNEGTFQLQEGNEERTHDGQCPLTYREIRLIIDTDARSFLTSRLCRM